jgi:hypothetical protein
MMIFQIISRSLISECVTETSLVHTPAQIPELASIRVSKQALSHGELLENGVIRQ